MGVDREKVINGLKQCKEWNGNCCKCPYHDKIDISECTANLCKDALALLKEQSVQRSQKVGEVNGQGEGCQWAGNDQTILWIWFAEHSRNV